MDHLVSTFYFRATSVLHWMHRRIFSREGILQAVHVMVLKSQHWGWTPRKGEYRP